MKLSNPLVSVIIPTCDEDPEYIKRAVESAFSQSYDNLEVVVVDGGNNDWLVNQYSSSHNLIYCSQQPRGVSAARNEAIDQAEGDIIAFLDCDDYYAEEKIERQVKQFRDGAEVVYTDSYTVLDGETSVCGSFSITDTSNAHIDFFRYDGMNGNIPTSSIAVRKKCIKEKRFNEQLAGGEDYHLWVRLFKDVTNIVHIEEPLVYISQRAESLSSDAKLMYENRVNAIELLADEYEEIAEVSAERKKVERYDYARHLLISGEQSEARKHLLDSLRKDRYYRATVLLVLSFLPRGHHRVLKYLDALRDWIVNP